MSRFFPKDVSAYAFMAAGTIGGILNGHTTISVHVRTFISGLNSGSSDNWIMYFGIGGGSSGVGMLIVSSGGSYKLQVRARSVVTDSVQTLTCTTALTS